MNRKLTLVEARLPGFGKTTLLAAWAKQAPCPTVWLTLDPEDDDLFTFVSYLVASIETVYPHACPNTSELLSAVTPLPTAMYVAVMANDLATLPGELAHGELAPGELAIVLDDYHWLKNIEIHNFLDSLIQYLPESVHLVLSTRTSPPLSLVPLRPRPTERSASTRVTLFRCRDAHLFRAVGATCSRRADGELAWRTN